MREKKSFFTTNNSLNRGGKIDRKSKAPYSDKNLVDLYRGASLEEKRKLEQVIRGQNNIPNPDLMFNIFGGAISRIGTMSFIFLFTIICYFSYNLITNNYLQEALAFSVISFTALIFIILKLKQKASGNSSNKYLRESNYRRKPKTYNHRKNK